MGGIPGTSDYCQIGIGTDTLSVGVDMPAIADAILIGDIDDSNGAFQKFGRLARRVGLVLNPRGIVYTTATALETAEQAIAAAENDEEDGKPNSKTEFSLSTIYLSWPTMLTIKCKEMGQHKLYNRDVVDAVCFCRTCGLIPPNFFAKKL